MRKPWHVLFFGFMSFASLLSAQTGPAGVGSTANNALWLKADAGTSSGTNNTPLSGWNDQSGNGTDVTQTVSTQQPSFATNVINGFPAVLFDNVSNTNDKMIGPDAAQLDNTSGYTFFTVTRPQNFGDAHAVVSKRTGVSIDQSFMFFYYTSNKMNVDIQSTNDRFASNTTFTTNTNYIIDLVYDGSLPTASRCAVYSEETLDRTASETNSFIPDNSSPLLIGTTDASDGRPFGGYIAEIIIYREALAPAKRIIINNYLSAKYNIALSANDKYFGDNSINGDYDRDVAGIGQESTGSSTSFSASVSGGLSVAANSGLDNTDYLMAGHAVATNTTITTDVGGMTGSNKARWLRTWYIDITNILSTINVNIEFDMSDGGMGAFTFGTVSNYVLLYRAGQTGNWTELATASAVTGDQIQFNNVDIATDGYYTLGTKNYNNSPLPIQLLYFNAAAGKNTVDLLWATASEKHTKSFLIEKTKDGIAFETVAVVPGAGESEVRKNYSTTDEAPYEGLSYYRLTEITTAGEKNSYPMVAVSFESDGDFVIFPNPSENSVSVKCSSPGNTPLTLVISDLSGKICLEKTLATRQKNETVTLDTSGLGKGMYVLKAVAPDKIFERKIILK